MSNKFAVLFLSRVLYYIWQLMLLYSAGEWNGNGHGLAGRTRKLVVFIRNAAPRIISVSNIPSHTHTHDIIHYEYYIYITHNMRCVCVCV